MALQTIKATTHRKWQSLQLLPRELKKKDPAAFKELENAGKEVKTRYHHRRHGSSALFREQLRQARVDRIKHKGWLFKPMSDSISFDLFLKLEITIGQLLLSNIVYIGINTPDGPKAELEFCRWALQLKESEIPACDRQRRLCPRMGYQSV